MATPSRTPTRLPSASASPGAGAPYAATVDYSGNFTGLVVGMLLGAFFLWRLAKKSCIRVRHSEVMIVERCGRFKEVLKPGIHWLWPLFDAPRVINWRYLDASGGTPRVVSVTSDRVDVREHLIDLGEQVRVLLMRRYPESCRSVFCRHFCNDCSFVCLMPHVQQVITKDTVSIQLDALVFFRIEDPLRAVFSVQNLPDAVELLTQSTLRNIIAGLTLDDTFSSREVINSELLSVVARDAERWGVRITRCEVRLLEQRISDAAILCTSESCPPHHATHTTYHATHTTYHAIHVLQVFSIEPPADILEAMAKQITAERERRSDVLRADGERESSIIESRGAAAKIVLEAEAVRASTVLRAKGAAEAKKIMAAAEAQCLGDIRSAVAPHGARGTDYLTAVEYLTSLGRLTGSPSVSMDGSGAGSGSGDRGSRASKAVLVPVDTMDVLGTVLAAARGR